MIQKKKISQVKKFKVKNKNLKINNPREIKFSKPEIFLKNLISMK